MKHKNRKSAKRISPDQATSRRQDSKMYRWLSDAGSIKIRFFFVASLAVILVVMIFHGFMRQALENYLIDQQINESEQTTYALIRNLKVEDGVPVYSWAGDDDFWRPYSGSYWQIVYGDNTVLRSRSLWDRKLEVRDMRTQIRSGFTTGPDLQPLLLYERLIKSAGLELPIHIAIASPLDRLEAGLADFKRTAYVLTFIISSLMMLTLIGCIAIGLFPLERLRVALVEIRDGRKQRLQGSFAKELRPIVTSFNTVIDRYGNLIERARVYGGNVAHGLKNPLAIIRLEIDKLRKETSPESVRIIEEQLSHMERHIQLELSRVRAAGAKAVPGQTCEAKGQLEILLKVVGQLYLYRDLDFSLDGEKAQVLIEEQDFKEILGNCIDNAFKWAKSKVAIRLVVIEGRAQITIEDDGPGIPLGQRKKLFHPGVRTDQKQTGTGLGLSIARSLLQMYGGKITLAGSRMGGLRVSIHIPSTYLPPHANRHKKG